MYLYGVFSKATNEPLYIGKSLTSDKRKCGHFYKAFKGRKDEVEFRIIREYDVEKFDWERAYITWYSLAYKLENKGSITKGLLNKCKDTWGSIPHNPLLTTLEYPMPYKWNSESYYSLSVNVGEEMWKSIELKIFWKDRLLRSEEFEESKEKLKRELVQCEDERCKCRDLRKCHQLGVLI